MNSILNAIKPKLSSNGVWPKVLGDLRVAGSHHFSEGLHDVLLANLQDDRGSRNELLDLRNVLREDRLIDIVELFDGGSAQVEHLHCRDFETFREDHIDDHASLSTLDNVRLDDAESAIVKLSSCLHWSRSGITSEPELCLSFH